MSQHVKLLIASGLFTACANVWAANPSTPSRNIDDPQETLLCTASVSTLNVDPIDDCGGGGGDPGGGSDPPPPPDPFSPPPMGYPQEFLPGVLANPYAGVYIAPYYYQTCQQFPHAFIAFSNDLTRGSTLYLSGIVAPGTFAVFGFYNQFGQLADLKYTNLSKNNCVIHHDENPFNTSTLAPGYYTVYANYVTLSPPGSLPIFGGSFPPGFNFYITVSGSQNTVSMRYVTTIRIR